MRRGDSPARLRELLAEVGLHPGGDVPAGAATAAWKTFVSFAAEPVEGLSAEDETDGLLFQTGVYDWHDDRGRHFSFSMVRQFTVEDADGEHDHTEQLELLLAFVPTPDLEALPRSQEWSFGLPLEVFAARVEALPAFRRATGVDLSAATMSVELGEV